MKKLAVVVMMTAIATFMATAIASAGADKGWDNIHGQYAVIATGACLHSTGGFDNVNPNPAAPPIWTPAAGSEVWGAPVMAYATYTFERDGTGASSVTNNIITLPPGDPILFANYQHFVGARQVPPALTPTPFTYKVAPDGVLTVWQGPLTLTGMVSTNHKTLTLANGDQVQPYLQSATHPNSSAICNVGRVLIRVDEDE